MSEDLELIRSVVHAEQPLQGQVDAADAALERLSARIAELEAVLKHIDREDHYEDRIDWAAHTKGGFPARDCLGCLAREVLGGEEVTR